MKKHKKTLIILSAIFISITTIFVALGAFYQNQINILVFGVEGTRADTMILVSMNTATNHISAVSIPRDTYFPTEGYTKSGQKKLNARYGFKNIGGPEGLKSAVEELMGIKIDHYVKLDYGAVEAIVNLIGGVEVDVPFRMKYDDPYSTPPLHIDFQPGLQVIMGNQAMEYLRFRKSNDGKISEGDVQRIVRQQDFMKSASKKALSYRLPWVASTALKYVETDISKAEVILYSSAMLGANMDKVSFYTLPMKSIGRGKDGLSYFFYDNNATYQLMKGIYDGSIAKEEAEAKKLEKNQN